MNTSHRISSALIATVRLRRCTVPIPMESPSRPAPIPQHLATWQRTTVIASSIVIGPILLLPLTFAAMVALPAIALAFPFFLASVWQTSKAPALAPARAVSRRIGLVDTLRVPTR